MRLQVEHDLQAMFQLAEHDVVLFQHRPFLQGQAAGLLQPVDGLQRVAGADLGQVAAVEQLQELDRELDVPDPAVAGLDVPLVAAFALACAVRSAASGPGCP